MTEIKLGGYIYYALLGLSFLLVLGEIGVLWSIDYETCVKDCDIEKLISDDLTDVYLENDDEAASACTRLATQNMSEPKSPLEVFDTLTPEQKNVAYYLIGDSLQRDHCCQEMQAASKEQIFAMQHIQDLVQANAMKKMEDIWRLHL